MSNKHFTEYNEAPASLPISEPDVLWMADTRPTAREGSEFPGLTSESEVGSEYTSTMEGGLEKVRFS